VLAIAGSALTAGPATGMTADTALPDYIDSQVNMFAAFANSHWKLSDGVTHAAQFDGNPTPNNYGIAIPGGDEARYMWAHHCSDDAQRVVFERKVWLPGTPQSIEIHASPSVLVRKGQAWTNPFKVERIEVNDEELASDTDSTLDVSGSAANVLGAFRKGKNVITLVVRKRANPDYIPACGGSNAPARLGVQLAVIGRGFPADLAVRAPATSAATQWYHLAPGGSKSFIWTFNTVNNGPSASRAGKFGLTIQPGFLQLSDIVTTNEEPPMHSCAVSGRTASCWYDDGWLQPDSKAAITAGWKVTAPTDEPDTDVEQMVVSWAVVSNNGQQDPKSTNNSASVTVYICYPAATALGCDKH
jgi:hypothetical protein